MERITLYVGAFHQHIDGSDFTDIFYITPNRIQILEALKKIEIESKKIFKMSCVNKSLSSIRCESLNGKDYIEAFYVERLVIIRKEIYE